MHEEPFGYRIAHHKYFLTSCPGPNFFLIFKNSLIIFFTVNIQNNSFFQTNFKCHLIVMISVKVIHGSRYIIKIKVYKQIKN